KGQEQTLRAAVFSPDGKRIVSASDKRSFFQPQGGTTLLKVWDAKAHHELFTIKEDLPYSYSFWPNPVFAFSPDSSRLATCSREGVKVWNALRGEQIAALGGSGALNLAFSPDGKRLVVGYRDKVVVWEMSTARALFTLESGG